MRHVNNNYKIEIMPYIVTSKDKEVFNVNGDSLGMRGERALYYSKSLGRHRIYRREYPNTDKSFVLFKYKSKVRARDLCDQINEAYNDDFEVVECN